MIKFENFVADVPEEKQDEFLDKLDDLLMEYAENGAWYYDWDIDFI